MVYRISLKILGAATIVIMTLALFAGIVQAQGTPSCVENSVGLAVDIRGNVYTANPKTGHVYYSAPSQEPVVLARVPGKPVLLAVGGRRNVFVGTDRGRIFRIGLNGSVVEVYRCEEALAGLGVDRDDSLILATREGKIITVRHDEFLR